MYLYELHPVAGGLDFTADTGMRLEVVHALHEGRIDVSVPLTV